MSDRSEGNGSRGLTPSGGVIVPFSFCPRCGRRLGDPESFVQEFWVAEETVYHCWCRHCSFTWNLVLAERVVGHEAVD